MQVSDVTVEVRDKTLTRLGVIQPRHMRFAATVYFNNVGIWQLDLSPDHPLAPALSTPGAGIIAYGPTETLFSGPMTKAVSTANTDDPFGNLTLTGVTDEVNLSDRLCYPQPSNPDATTQTLAHDTRSGVAETVMRAYVNANAGPGAPSVRQVKYLTVPASAGLGLQVTKNARFNVLGELLADIALPSNLGFRVVQRETVLAFEVFSPKDLTSSIRLDLFNNTLSQQEFSLSGPTATQIIVAGQGEEVNRAFYVGTNADAQAGEAAWQRRIERFVDQRQTDDSAEYAQAANEVLADEGSTQVAAALTPTDDATMRFGYDWNLGDRISTVANDSEYTAIVTAVAVRIDPDGCKVGAVLGDPSLLSIGDSNSALLRSTASRVSALERAT